MRQCAIRLGLFATCSVSGLVALAVANPALAQAQVQSQAGGEGSSGDIIVTARRVEERLQDVPISMTVFSQDELSRRNIVSGIDLAANTPSLSVQSNYGPDRATFAIRGFVQEANTGPSVGVYFADVVNPRGSQSSLASGGGVGPGRFFDLQNVQVLKGPQGTLFGRNTTGGAVLLVPRKPTDKLEGYAEASVGNYSMRRFQGVLNAPLAETVRLRLGVDRQVRDGYIHNKSGIGPEDYANVDYWALRASLVVDVTPDLENYLIGTYTNSKTNGYLAKIYACAPSFAFGGFGCGQLSFAKANGDGFYDVRADNPAPRSDNRDWQIINTTTWRASDDLTVKNIASYGRLQLDAEIGLFGSTFRSPPLSAIPGLLPGGLPSLAFPFVRIVNIPGRHTVDQNTFTDELQLQGSAVDGKLTWQAGGYFENSTPNAQSGQYASVLASCTDIVARSCTDPLGVLTGLGFGLPPGAVSVGTVNYTTNDYSFRSIGLYGQGTYALTDTLKLTAGFRYTWDRTKVSISSLIYSFANSTPLPPSCAQAESALPNCTINFAQSSQAPTWVVDLEYSPNSDTMIFAKYSRGYRAGGISAVLTRNLANYQPEKVDTYEVGLKASFAGALKGYLNITGFYNDFTNQQLSVNFNDNPAVPGTLPPQVGIVNVGGSRIYGVELEASVTPFAGFTLSGNYAYLNTKVLDVVLPNTAGQPYLLSSAIVAGDVLTQSPRNKFTITAAYTLPLDDKIGRITLGATFAHADSQRSNYASRQTLTGAFGTVLDANLNPVVRDFGILGPQNLLNLSLEWKAIAGSPIDLSFFATNVTKRKFYTYDSGQLPSLGIGTAAVNEPRMFGGRVHVSF
ncbi:TonB-dependent receptor [Novosphingobium sp. G106]|uniref:TonB-dependent receptor n=1 Tax=Novosphingobium sp. G106 TaxID=2849500 RepID=UPI001C2DD0BB|nr:TonB-dependent receptor [Novosphingobium sp. G106]MBV1688191.1 TonB-dependent receptor [Novosphingobium sp. G106]